MSDKKRTYGQYETPSDVADLMLSFCLQQPDDCVLDPSCGAGALLFRAAQMKTWSASDETPTGALWGIELDPEAAMAAQASLPQAHIVNRSFFDLSPWMDRPFDALIGNPPYTRSEWIGRLADEERTARQLSIFDEPVSLTIGDQPQQDVVHHRVLDKRAGLHAHFFVHGTRFLREGGRFGFVVPNSWLDVAYGERLKQFLLDHYKILAIIESSVERWFRLAKVNTCIVILEKCSDTANRLENSVRLVRLRRPLQKLIARAADDRQRIARLDKLTARMQMNRSQEVKDLSVRVVRQHKLDAADRWGIRLRAPAVIQKRAWKANLHPLKSWASVQRGFTTGANNFFYLDEDAIEEWEIEAKFRRPVLKSLRHVDQRRVTVEDCELQVLQIPPTADLVGTSARAYVDWGEEQGWHQRSTCASRNPWYSLPEQEEAPLLLAKGIWERHFAPFLDGSILVDQQLYHVHLAQGVPAMAAAALLNSAWFGLQMELYGRVNFGDGLLWLAAYELEGLLMPDPRYLPDEHLADLVDSFQGLIDLPVETVYEELAQPSWQAFNARVFEILGLSHADGRRVTEALLESVTTRRMKAGKGSLRSE